MTIDQLPRDVWGYIFANCAPSDLSNVACACKAFREFVEFSWSLRIPFDESKKSISRRIFTQLLQDEYPDRSISLIEQKRLVIKTFKAFEILIKGCDPLLWPSNDESDLCPVLVAFRDMDFEKLDCFVTRNREAEDDLIYRVVPRRERGFRMPKVISIHKELIIAAGYGPCHEFDAILRVYSQLSFQCPPDLLGRAFIIAAQFGRVECLNAIIRYSGSGDIPADYLDGALDYLHRAFWAAADNGHPECLNAIAGSIWAVMCEKKQ